MVLSAVALLLIVGAGPVTEADGMRRPFVKRLAEEARTGPSNVNPFGLAAAFGNGSDSAKRLQIGCASIPVSLRSKRGQQAWRQGRPSTGKEIEDSKIWMCRHGLWSMLQSVGLAHSLPRERALKRTALLIAFLIVLGYISIPIGIMLMFIK